MDRFIVITCCILLAAPLGVFSENNYENAENMVIYGSDDRVEVKDAPLPMQEWARSVAVKISSREIGGCCGRGGITVGRDYIPAERVCSDEPFFHQIDLSECTGFLVDEDLLLTAGHCISPGGSCRNYYWVFDYIVPEYGDIEISADNVYACAEVLYPDIEWTADVSLVRLDRKVVNRRPLPVRRSGSVKVGDQVVAIGSPLRRPLKVSANARVRQVYRNYFTANLDVYDGSSGSPVINIESGLVEGVLVGGEDDFFLDEENYCYRSKVCSDDGCMGETSVILKNILW